MFPSQFRLSRSQFPPTLKAGTRSHHQFFTLITHPGDTRASKVAIIVSKKTAPQAVDRNHLKRLFREAIRPLLPTLPPQNLIFIIKSNSIGKPLSTISRAIKERIPK